MEIRALHPADDRTSFRSGNTDLDRFFVRYAGQNHFKHHIGVTYVAVDGEQIVGFATVVASQIEIEDLPLSSKKRLPKYPLPVLRLARLAADVSVQGKGVGMSLLRFVFSLALKMAETLGCVGLVVDAKDETVAFYERYGFERLGTLEGAQHTRPQPTPMFLPIGEIPRTK